ncbi:hypothetical protein GGR52DRAFT_567568 [Hypoxylon sp. FL1284]|nr:hypothetical protein GGR52DRAFT_567568 [Hypoxylon sp. FL1284]
MSYPPSYGSDSTGVSTQCSGSSGAYSNGTAATQYTDPVYDPNVGNAYHMLPGTVLPCEFVGLSSCDETFGFDEADMWIEHIVTSHLRNKLPSKGLCWYCDDYQFTAKDTAQGDRRMNFEYRMEHIRQHIADGFTANNIRPDFHMIEHLHSHRLISDTVYNWAKQWTEVPGGSSHMSHIHPPNFVPPERKTKQYHDSKVVVKESRKKDKKKK